jgi:LemA protein
MSPVIITLLVLLGVGLLLALWLMGIYNGLGIESKYFTMSISSPTVVLGS